MTIVPNYLGLCGTRVTGPLHFVMSFDVMKPKQSRCSTCQGMIN